VDYLKYLPPFNRIYHEIKESMDLFKVFMRDLGRPTIQHPQFGAQV
jgi:hypothetical protein